MRRGTDASAPNGSITFFIASTRIKASRASAAGTSTYRLQPSRRRRFTHAATISIDPKSFGDTRRSPTNRIMTLLGAVETISSSRRWRTTEFSADNSPVTSTTVTGQGAPRLVPSRPLGWSTGPCFTAMLSSKAIAFLLSSEVRAQRFGTELPAHGSVAPHPEKRVGSLETAASAHVCFVVLPAIRG
jgi:hypothetical protein